jgi:two-component system, OmpR family, sensor kinase
VKRGESTLFRQTLLVLVGALILAHVVSFFTFLLLPPREVKAVTLSGLASQLADPACDSVSPELAQARELQLSRSPQPPVVPSGMRTDPALQAQLAQALGVPESTIRLGWEEGSEIQLKRPVDFSIDNRAVRMAEVVFLRELIVARQWPQAWCVAEVPPRSWISSRKFNVPLSVLLLSMAVLLPFAWVFARRLSRPMHDFATAADAIGRNEQAPLLDEQGPQEMRIAARALNAMQVRIQEQLREREAMIAAIAHDLRTPLSRIAFRVEAASPSASESVQRDIEQMNAMITATLEFSREGKHSRGDQVVDLNALLSAIADDEQAIHHNVQFASQADAVFVEGDELQLNRLFQNLIDNALNFGGIATLELRAEGGRAVVTVADNGPGIASGQVEEMFRPFKRGDPSRNRQTGGVGLGLSIARAIAQRHGADLQVANRPEGGLLVTVTIPVATG